MQRLESKDVRGVSNDWNVKTNSKTSEEYIKGRNEKTDSDIGEICKRRIFKTNCKTQEEYVNVEM